MPGILETINWARSKLHDAERYVVDDLLVGWSPARVPDLQGKVALVTGGNSGLGFETVRKLAENGCMVYLVSRDYDNGVKAAEKIRRDLGKGAKIEVLGCDFSKLRNVLDLVQRVRRTLDRLDIIVPSMAGVFHPGAFAVTEDGIEQTLAIDYFAPMLLTLGLLPLLRSTPGARIVFMASAAEQFGKYDPENITGVRFKESGLRPYGAAKLYLLMAARELAGRLPDVDVFVVHPGVVLTPLQYKASWRYITAAVITTQARLFGLTPHVGAYSTIYACTEPSLTGKHFAYLGPSYALNLFQTSERTPVNPATKSIWSCWQIYERTVATLREKVAPLGGTDLLKGLPKHPDDHEPHPRAAHAHNGGAPVVA